jgi:hypothetical protein
MKTFKEIFFDQRSYNNSLRGKAASKEEWTQTYLLGLIGCVNDVLRETNWKKHSKEQGRKLDRVNVGIELSDLTKYVLSLWDVWGFTDQEILDFVELRSNSLLEQTAQEFSDIPEDVPIVICDIDGTIGDWRTSFIEWLRTKGIEYSFEDPRSSLMIDDDLSMLYIKYYDLKEEYESSGQYRKIKLYPDSYDFLWKLKNEYNAYIISITARPSERYRRIWMDSWLWVKENNLPIDKLQIGTESRILLADSLIRQGRQVIMLDDNPELITRGANSGISIIARGHGYNRGIVHRNVRIVDSFKEVDLSNYLRNPQQK